MKYNYNTSGVCSSAIEFDIQDDVIQDVTFKGGCNGNLKGISLLVKGMNPKDAAKRLSGVGCGSRGTSCPDQLSKALNEVYLKDRP